jgi:bacteriocin biosynthesis cyclodehydratase domain-containing protein
VSNSDHRDVGAADRAAVVGPQGVVTGDRGASPASGAPRYRLRSAFEPFFASDGDVYLLRTGGPEQHVIRAPDASERELLRRLAGEGVEVTPASAAAASLAPLLAAGVVVAEPATSELGADAERFARQLPYLEDFGDPVELQRRLRRSCIAIVGCGGLGTWALGALATLGVGRFVLVDDDTVDLSNLNRQILYRVEDIGQPKVDVAAEWLRRFDPTIEVVARRERIGDPATLEACIAGCSALLLTADWPPYDLVRWANVACAATGVPLLTAGQQPPLLKIGPTYLAGHGPCFACHERQIRRDYPLYDELADQRRRNPPEAMTLGPASGVIGTLMALEVLRLLVSDQPPALLGRALLVDMHTLDMRYETIESDPACSVCGAPGGSAADV